jgi:hypothetical protein
MLVLISSGIELNGLMRVTIPCDSIQASSRLVLKGVSAALAGTIIVSDIVPGVGVGLSSTSPTDVGQTVYFDIVEPDVPHS